MFDMTGLAFMRMTVLDEALKRLERHSRFYKGEGATLWWERFSAYRRHRRVIQALGCKVDHLVLNRTVLFFRDTDNSLRVIR